MKKALSLLVAAVFCFVMFGAEIAGAKGHAGNHAPRPNAHHPHKKKA